MWLISTELRFWSHLQLKTSYSAIAEAFDRAAEGFSLFVLGIKLWRQTFLLNMQTYDLFFRHKNFFKILLNCL